MLKTNNHLQVNEKGVPIRIFVGRDKLHALWSIMWHNKRQERNDRPTDKPHINPAGPLVAHVDFDIDLCESSF